MTAGGGLRRPWAPRPLLTGQLADRTPGTGVVDQGLALGRRGHERRGGGVVQRPGQTVGVAVQASRRVVGDEGICPPGQRQMVAQVRQAFRKIHPGDLIAHRDALVEGGKTPRRSWRESMGWPKSTRAKGDAAASYNQELWIRDFLKGAAYLP